MRRTNDAGAVEHRPDRRRGLANQIDRARARRNLTELSREDFLDDPVAEPGGFEPTHSEFREELRRIIADDAERAANEQVAPTPEVVEDEVPVPVRRHSRLKIAAYWLGCFFGIGAVAYSLARTT